MAIFSNQLWSPNRYMLILEGKVYIELSKINFITKSECSDFINSSFINIKVVVPKIKSFFKVSLYHDGQTLERPIQGVYRQVVMEHLRPVYGFPIIRRNKTGSEDHYQALRNKIENSVKMEAIANNGNDILTLGNEKDKLEKSLNQSRTTKIDFRFSEEVEPEWRMPRDNSNKISWVKPLMSSSSSTSTSFNVVLTTLFILTFCRFAQFLN